MDLNGRKDCIFTESSRLDSVISTGNSQRCPKTDSKDHIWTFWHSPAHRFCFYNHVNISLLLFFTLFPHLFLCSLHFSRPLLGELVWPNRADLSGAGNSYGCLGNKWITRWTLSACNLILSLGLRLFLFFFFSFFSRRWRCSGNSPPFSKNGQRAKEEKGRAKRRGERALDLFSTAVAYSSWCKCFWCEGITFFRLSINAVCDCSPQRITSVLIKLQINGDTGCNRYSHHLEMTHKYLCISNLCTADVLWTHIWPLFLDNIQ